METIMSKEQRIISAAEQVFSKHGYEKSTVDEIIALADVGKGTLYKYFGNKEQLFYQLVMKKNVLFVASLDAAVVAATGFENKLVAFLTEMITFYKANAALWQIICFEMLGSSSGCMVRNVDGVPTVVSRYEVTPTEEQKELMIRYHMLLQSEFSILQRLIEEGTDAGVLKRGDAEVETMYLFFGVAMCIFHPHTVVEQADPVTMARKVADSWLRGFQI